MTWWEDIVVADEVVRDNNDRRVKRYYVFVAERPTALLCVTLRSLPMFLPRIAYRVLLDVRVSILNNIHASQMW